MSRSLSRSDRPAALQGRIGSAMRPLSLAGSPRGTAVAAACAVAMVAIVAVETTSANLASLGSLIIIPVGAAAWLVGGGQFVIVLTAATGLRLFGVVVAGVDWGTALAEVTTILLIGVSARAAAVGLAAWQAMAARLLEKDRDLKLLEQRDQIGAAITDSALHTLYGVTLQLEAAAVAASPADASRRIRQSVAELDELCTKLRTIIFTEGQAPEPVQPSPAQSPERAAAAPVPDGSSPAMANPRSHQRPEV